MGTRDWKKEALPFSRAGRVSSAVSVVYTVLALAAVLLLAPAPVSAQSSHDGGTPAESKGGTSSSSTYAPDKLETVNLANGNLSMSLPLITVGGRGSAPFAVTLSYNSKVWSSFHKQDPAIKQGNTIVTPALDHYYARYDDPGVPEPNRLNLGGGWFISLGPAIKVRSVDIDPEPATICPNSHADDGCGFKYILTKAWLTLPDGSEVELRDNLTDGSPSLTPVDGNNYHTHIDRDRGRVWHSADGSFVTLVLDPGQVMVNEAAVSGWVFLADGSRLRIEGGNCKKIIDADGNYITIETANGSTTYTDELGRQTVLQFVGGVATVTAKGYLGAPDRAITVNTGVIGSNLRADFADTVTYPRPFTAGDYWRVQGQEDTQHTITGPHTDLFDQSETEQLDGAHVDERTAVTAVHLFDGRSINFRYNQYGEVAEIIYPGGGVSQIDYGKGPSSLCGGFAPFNNVLDRRVSERRLLTDGTNVDVTWLYGGSSSSILATVEAHKGDRNGNLLLSEKHYFVASVNAQHMICTPTRQNGTGYETSGNAKENRVERMTGTGTIVTVRNWEQRAPVTWPSDPDLSVNSYVNDHGAGEEDIANDPRVTWEEMTLENGKTKRVEYTYDQFNNVTSVKEYDFRAAGAQPLVTPLRQTFKTYIGGGTTPSYNGYCYTNLNPLDSSCGSDLASDVTTIIHQRHVLLSEEVKDGAGNRESYGDYEYDNYAGPDWGGGDHNSLVTNAGMTMYDGGRFTPSFDSNHQPRGNVTKIRAWIEGSDGDQPACTTALCTTSYNRYDNAGSVVARIDPNGNISKVSYVDDFGDGTNPGGIVAGPQGATFAFPTAATNALNQVVKTQYDYTLGAATGVKDANGVVTRTEYDQAGRPVKKTAALNLPEQAVAEMSYPTASSNVATASRQIDATRWLASKTEMDGFDRPVLAATAEDGQKADVASFTVFTATVYDPLGRAEVVTNPYRSQSASTDGWTRKAYDLAGRVSEVATFAGGVPASPADTTCTTINHCTGSVVTTYASEQTTVVDQANKQRRSTMDGLGRLVSVDEMNESPSTSVYATTSYDYDARGNLKTVTQGQQTRSFTYDGLSRLKSAKIPEVCEQQQAQCVPVPVNYEYDLNGNLKKKTDPRPLQDVAGQVTISYDYDALNRVTARTYNDGTANVTYTYDTGYTDQQNVFHAVANANGRLTQVSSSLSTYSYTAYDALGRVKGSSQTTRGATYSMPDYQYDLAGNLISEQYPSGRVVKTEYDAAGRVAGVKNQASGLYYAGAVSTDSANRIQYTAGGAPSSVKLGNGLWEHTTFNSRLQPTQIGLGTSATNSSALQLDYSYGLLVNSTLDATKNNGNVQGQTITVPGMTQPYVQTYLYDDANRLSSAVETNAQISATTPTWKQVYTYDRYGNRTLASGTTYPAPLDATNNPEVSQADNRITSAGYAYDNAGNLLCDPQHPCGNGSSTSAPSSSISLNYFAYDAENRMVQSAAQSGGMQYGYDGDGRRVQKILGTQVTVFVYDAAGRMVAEYRGDQPQTTGTSYVTQDALGSTRIVTGQDQTDVRARYDYLPFGEEVYLSRSSYGGSNDIKQKFTGKERDNETGLDYFLARYYSSQQGRFISPDPLSASAHPNIPQGWNCYSYVLNNPLKLVDPDGMMWVYHYLDKEHKRIGIAWIDGNKIPKGLKARGYQALDFGGHSSMDVTTTDGSVNRLSANSSIYVQLRGPQQSGSDGGYVNTGLVRELGRRTAPMPGFTVAFVLVSLNGGYIVAGSSIAALDAAAYALYAVHEMGKDDAQGNGTQVMGSTSSQYLDITTGKSIRNIQTDVSKSDFIKNMEASGYKATRSGNVVLLDNGVNRYTVYDVAKSTGGPTAVQSVAGEQTLKIRLKP